MGYDVVIQAGTIVTASERFIGDIGIKGEKVAAIGEKLEAGPNTRCIPAKGLYVIPGGIDVHVHFQLPFCGTVSSDDFVTGTKAAACGGVTTIIDYASQDPRTGILGGIKARRAEAEGKACVDFALHSTITRWDDSMPGQMAEAIRIGVPSFKMFMIYESEGWMSDDAALFSALEQSRRLGCRIMVHAESQKVLNMLIRRYRKQKGIGAYGHVLSRPNFIEAEAIQRAITWAEVTGAKLYIVHMSTGEGADLVKAAQCRGVQVLAETCPQYLILSDDVFKRKATGHLYATCPQIKKKRDGERLWQALHDGEVAIVATDTCTFTKKQKAMWKGDFTRIPYGIPGVETMLPILYTHGVLRKRLDMHRFVELISTNPAKIMGLWPRKGAIQVGSDADVTIFHPRSRRIVDFHQMQTRCDWSPYQGMKLAGFPHTVLLRGRIIVDDGRFVGEQGYGRFSPRFLR